MAGSPARDYGCQTFAGGAANRLGLPAPAENRWHRGSGEAYPKTVALVCNQWESNHRLKTGATRVRCHKNSGIAPAATVGRGDVIEVSGPIVEDTTWDAELVRVVGDVTVIDGVTLTISPGARVEFGGYYRLSVAGTLLAVGTPAARIVFTAAHPEEFTIDAERAGCWNGIRFAGAATNVASELRYCKFEYSKALSGDADSYPYAGGALSIIEFSHLTIANCVFRHNLAEYGGAIFMYRNANPLIAGNLLVDNHAIGNASAIYAAYSHPHLINNTIVRNTIHNEANPYIHTCGILSFIGKPVFTNNIVRDNLPTGLYLHDEMLNYKTYCTWHNNITEIEATQGNFDADPRFVDPLGLDGVAGTFDDDFRLSVASPGLDAGLNDAWAPPCGLDLDGAERVLDSTGAGELTIDQGAYEFGDCDGDGVLDIKQIAGGDAADCNENYVLDYCELHYHETALDCNLNEWLDECETTGAGDYDGDGMVGSSDLHALLGVLAGPDCAPATPDERCGPFYLTVFDWDGDGDLDLVDVAEFGRRFERSR